MRIATGQKTVECHHCLSFVTQKRETLTSLRSKELDYKFVESSEDGDFMLALDAVELVEETF